MPRESESGKLFEAADVLRQKAKELRAEAVRLEQEAEGVERRASQVLDGYL